LLDHALDYTRTECSGMYTYCNVTAPSTYWDEFFSLEGYVPQGYNGTQYIASTLSTREALRDNLPLYALDAFNNFDPGKPDVDILNFIWELREFPQLMKHAGDILRLARKSSGVKQFASAPGDAYLAYSFGWKPLLQDLTSMLDFATLFDKRLKYLDSIAAGTKVRRTLQNSSHEEVSVYNTGYTPIETTKTTSTRVWYEVELTSEKLASMRADERLALAKSLVYNTSLKPSTVWNSIPWTWLIDWFSTIGTYIQLVENSRLYEWKSLNVMGKITIDSRDRVLGLSDALRNKYYVGPNATGNGRRLIESKYRYVTSVVPLSVFDLRLVTNHQTRILGSLLTSRLLGGRTPLSH